MKFLLFLSALLFSIGCLIFLLVQHDDRALRPPQQNGELRAHPEPAGWPAGTVGGALRSRPALHLLGCPGSRGRSGKAHNRLFGRLSPHAAFTKRRARPPQTRGPWTHTPFRATLRPCSVQKELIHACTPHTGLPLAVTRRPRTTAPVVLGLLCSPGTLVP